MSLPENRFVARLRFAVRAVGGYNLTGNSLAVIAAAGAVATPQALWPTILLWIALVWAVLGPVIDVRRDRQGRADGDPMAFGRIGLNRVVVLLGALAVSHQANPSVWTVVIAILISLLVLVEQGMRRPIRTARPVVANLPGWDITMPSERLANSLFWINSVGVALALASASFNSPLAVALIAVVPSVVGTGLLGLQALKYLTGRSRFEKNLPKILKELGPLFAFHWQAPAGTAYQASMWLPYLARLGVPYFVLARTSPNFYELAKLTDAPLILRVTLEDLDPIVTDSLKVIFYANTAVRNSHMVRFPQFTHVQLNHGDSDKVASVSPTFRQYDKNFVAGQAAIDRFAKHGVSVRDDSFEIVGRPQLEAVKLATGPISEKSAPTVLYSPTWSGFYEDSDYSSLSAGPKIVEGLLQRGCKVVFRPHPYSRRHKGNAEACDTIIEMLTQDAAQTGREHVFGEKAETQWSIMDCFNASDAMVSDVSSVVSDYLISGKPFAMGAVSTHGDAFQEEFPLSEAAYVMDIKKDRAEGLDEALDNLLGPDPKSADRDRLRAYYLGDYGPEECVQHFVEKARSYLV